MDAKILMQDLAAGVSQRSGLLKKDSDTFVRLFFETLEECLSEEKNVKIKGLGSFKIVEVSGRDSVNVNTGERIHIKGHSKITFTPDTGLKNVVNRPFADFETVVLNDGVDVEKMEYTGEAETEQQVLPESIVVEDTPAVEEAAVAEDVPAVEENAPVVEEATEVVEESAAEEAVAEEAAVKESVAEEAKAEEAKVVVAPGDEKEPPAPNVEPDVKPSGKGRSILLYFVGIACVAVLAVLGYCFATGKLTLTVNTQTVEQVEQKTKTQTTEARKPVVKKEPVKEEPKPEVATFDSATVNARFPYGAYEICGIQCKHVVAEGEDIETIAKQYLKSKSNKVYIAAMNDISTYKPVVEVGQELIIPEIRMKKRK